MDNFIIITDSSCDFPADIVKKLGIEAAPLSVVIEGKKYLNHLDEREISFKRFYSLMREKKTAETAAVNPDMFYNLIEKYVSQGTDVLYLGFSSALSGTCSAFASAAEDIREKYPDRKVYMVDTLSASLGQGLLLYLTAAERKKGRSIDEVRDYAESMKLKICHWFTVDDLQHLRRGGRVSSATAAVGTLLGIKPIMHMDDNGKLVAVDKVRGRKAAINELLNRMRALAVKPGEQTVFISHGDCREDAEYLAGLIKSAFGTREIIINFVGPVIDAHSGPGTLALFFIGTER